MSVGHLSNWAAYLLDPDTVLDREKLLPLMGELQEFFAKLTGVNGEHNDGPSKRYLLPSGMVLPYQSAATCLFDPLRTVQYLRALNSAIKKIRGEASGKPVHVLYAGTGPYAPYANLICSLYSPEEVQFTLIEFHSECVRSVLGLVKEFGFEKHIPTIIHGDAANYSHKGNAFQICVVECMQKALTQECQVAITCNLARQLDPDGFFIPESVVLDACLAHPDEEFRPAPGKGFVSQRHGLGQLFRLDRSTYSKAVGDDLMNCVFPCPEIDLSGEFLSGFNLTILTRIQLFGDIVLRDFESGLTVPYMLFHVDGLRDTKSLKSEYRVCQYPGLYFKKEEENVTYDPFRKDIEYPAHGIATGM